MTIKNNVINNKKKVSIISTISILFVVLLIGIVYMRFYANAGVFKKNSKTNTYDYKKEVNILEVVAQYGQQVLGYTVTGSEPITKDQIEDYHGDIDIDDFKKATGYELTKEKAEDDTYNYTVKSNILKDTFNSNVLQDSMDLSEKSGESINVTVCQANELTDDIINKADLVFINSHDYNENLLYYYDQIVNKGANGVKAGQYGANYCDTYQENQLKTTAILANMKKAAGSETFSKALVKEDFEALGLKNYKEYNFDQYIDALSTAEKNSLDGKKDDETIVLIDSILSKVNTKEKDNANSIISTYANRSEYTEDDINALTSALMKSELSNCYYSNYDEYITGISKAFRLDSFEKIQEIVTSTNTTETTNAINKIVAYKVANITTEDNTEIVNSFLKLGYEKVNEFLAEDYVDALMDESFTLSAPTNQATNLSEIKELVNKVNGQRQKDILEIIANAPKSEDQIKDVKANAKEYFSIVSKDYGQMCKNIYTYNINKYCEALAKLSESTEETSNLQKTDIATTTDYHYDLDKIQAFIDNVNKDNSNVTVDKSFDMTWTSAMILYNHIFSDDSGLMYNSQLLTGDKIKVGDYKTNSDSNINNIYKFLLVTRQIRDTYFTKNFMPKIDSNGVYYSEGLNPDGTGIGTGINSWWKETFGNDFTNYEKFREPEVVGKTYTEAGLEGSSVNYVYKHIYSFTGEQFLGGEKFVNGISVESSLLGLATDSVDITDHYIFLDLSAGSHWKNSNNNPYAYFWSDDGKSKTIQMELQDEAHLQYKVMVPDGMQYVIFRPNENNWDNQTGNLILGNQFTNRVYNITEEQRRYKQGRNWIYYYVYSTSQDSKTVYSANMTNSIRDKQVEFYKSLDVNFTGCGVTNARYRIDDGAWINGLKLGNTITIGKDAKVDQIIKLEVQYDTFTKFSSGGGETKVYYYKKIDDKSSTGKNYLSFRTGSNIENLVNSATQASDFNAILNNATKGDIIRYISGFTLNVLTDLPYKVLELEPSANISVYNSYDGAVRLAKMLKVDVSGMNKDNWTNYFEITPLGVREFNTRNYDYLSDFDLIYIGNSVKNQLVDTSGRTVYKNDTSLNGYVYTGIGDYYYVKSYFGGTAASDYKLANRDDYNSWDSTHKTIDQYWKSYAFDEFTGNSVLNHSNWNLDKNEYYYIKDNKVKARMIGTDITVKKMEQLMEYVQAGAPLMVNDNILNCDVVSGNGKSYVDPNSKMYNFISKIKQLGLNAETDEYTGLDSQENQIFSDGGKFANIVNESTAETGKNPANLGTKDKFNGGLSYASKRNVKIEFTLQSSPQQYTRDKQGKLLEAGNTGTYITEKDSDYSTYEYVLKVNTNIDMDEVKNSYDFQVYIDKSGTGKFDGSLSIAIDPNVVFDNEKHTITLKGNWPGNMEGFVPWKVVASNKQNPNNYFSEVGYSAFINPIKKNVYVLWVKPDSGHTINMNFEDMVNNNKDNIKDYNIIVVSCTYSEFVAKWNGSTETNYTDEKSKLRIKEYLGNSYTGGANDQFNMLVFGFCDSYGGLDINNVSAIKNIDYFLNTGHSLLFSHDNSSTLSTFNYYSSGNNRISRGSTDFGMYTTTMMRKMLGMDVFGATYSGSAFDITNKNTFVESVYNARSYLNASLGQEDFRGICEMNMFRYNSSDNNGFYTDDNNNVEGICSNSGLANTTSVMRTNEGQITDYPFIIGNTLDIATTHAQYLGLNQEDKDLTVWYTLDKQKSGDDKLYKYAKGDGSNNYYIYSKGNITYTGAGHSKDDNKKNEQRLFINTVIAAIKLGSLKPDVTFPGAKTNTNGKNVFYKYGSDSGVNISFKATDYDFKKGELPFVQCNVFVDINNDGVYTQDKDILLSDTKNPYISNITDENNKSYSSIIPEEVANRTIFSFSISNDKLLQIGNDNKMVVNNVRKSIYEVPIVVQVAKTSSKDPSIIISAYNSVYIESRDLFELR